MEPHEIVVRIGHRVFRAPHLPGDTVLATLRRAGLPISTQCEQAYCGTCVFELRKGDVLLRHNDVLTEADLASGLRLACQGVPEGEIVEIELY